jgi:hypothetical protein
VTLLASEDKKLLNYIVFLFLNRNVFAEVSPACAVIGGVMAQEIIKAVSQKESPHNNMFFLNPTKNVGLVDCIGN